MNNYLPEVESKVRGLLARYVRDEALMPDSDIFAMGFVNSLFAMQLITLVEKEFAIEVTNDDLDLANFRSMRAMADFVQRKKHNAH